MTKDNKRGKHYTKEFKDSILKRLEAPTNETVTSISEETGVSKPSIYNWIKESNQNQDGSQINLKSKSKWSSEDKFHIVLETASMNENELGEYCRNKGIYLEELKAWKIQCLSANTDIQEDTSKFKELYLKDQAKIKELEKDLRRKEKALAETAALLVLRKKGPSDLGGQRGRMISALDRQIAVELINEARTAGARLAPACKVLNISERTYQRWTKEGGVAIDQRPLAVRPQPKNKLSEQERNMIIDLSTSPTYADLPPSKIVPKLADEGKYLASESTFYRVLREERLNTHRSRSKKASTQQPPTHIAVAPNQVWTWDITWLNASIKGEYYKLYLILDMFSRFIVGYEVWHKETAEHAKQLIRKATIAQKTANRPIILHSDNGSPMKAATFLATLEKLGVTSSFSRPRVSNDNPYSESLFKTMKYRPKYPYKGFSSLFEAREWVAEFVDWYNNDHLHSGLKFITPYQRHYNLAQDIMNKRTQTYQQAKARHPERWSGKIRDWSLPEFVCLNPMSEKEIETHINIKIPEQNYKVLTL